MHVFLHHKSSWLPHSSVFCVNDLLRLDQRLSHSKMDLSQPLPMKSRSGSKTLIYGTAAGIDPHRINRSKLPPWYIAGPCYRSPPCQFSPFPSRSALRAVGQSSRTALLLLPAYLTSSSPNPCLHLLCPCAPITIQLRRWLQPPSYSTTGVGGERTCWQHKMASNQEDTGFRNTIKP